MANDKYSVPSGDSNLCLLRFSRLAGENRHSKICESVPLIFLGGSFPSLGSFLICLCWSVLCCILKAPSEISRVFLSHLSHFTLQTLATLFLSGFSASSPQLKELTGLLWGSPFLQHRLELAQGSQLVVTSSLYFSGSQPERVEWPFQGGSPKTACISDIQIKIHNSSKIRVMK